MNLILKIFLLFTFIKLNSPSVIQKYTPLQTVGQNILFCTWHFALLQDGESDKHILCYGQM